jgi:hypothetical protein
MEESMSILDRIDEFLVKEQKRLRKRDPKLCLKESFDMDETLDKMGNFIYSLDPNVLDAEGKRIREEILSAFEPPFELTDRDWTFDQTHLDDDTSEIETVEEEALEDTISDRDVDLEDDVAESKKPRKTRLKRLTESKSKK